MTLVCRLQIAEIRRPASTCIERGSLTDVPVPSKHRRAFGRYGARGPRRVSCGARSITARATFTSRSASRRSSAMTAIWRRSKAGRRSTRRPARGDRRARSAPPSRAARRLLRDGRARHRLPGRRPAALPRERVSPARRDLVRVPRDPERRAHFESLGLPPGVRRLAEQHHGLVLVTGATGAGKTTTLAAMIGHINRTRRQHIVTIEDPIEILHDDEQLDRQPARGRARHRRRSARRSAARSGRTRTSS